MERNSTRGIRSPRPKAQPALGRNGFKYRQQFGVIVICADERAQALAYGRLSKAGYKLRVVTV